MITEKVLLSLQFDKILRRISEYAVLSYSKEEILQIKPYDNLKNVTYALNKTEEAYNLQYYYGFSGVDFFDDVEKELELSQRGATLSMSQLLKIAGLLRSSRLVKTFISSVNDDNITIFKDETERIYFDNWLEKDITSKILSDEQMADNASELLFALRRKIKNLNLQIKEKLQYYIRSKSSFLQDNIVTMRENRYVIPVKSEHKTKISGFIHDQSATGSTFFIEPIEVLEMNNQLKSAMIEEENEIERILSELSGKVGAIAQMLALNILILTQTDIACAKATYAYKTKAVKPLINDNGNISIKEGKHPLIDPLKVVPINVALGLKYNYLLISGPNTGGKTVTLKLVGLFCVMAMSGIFIQADKQSCISVFENIFTDIGDEQSIENSLSTFSSHLTNLINICDKCNSSSLVLLDELGGGTNPDEGIAIAKAVFDRLLERKSYGIVTTHYTALKEYAFETNLISNASMEFDSNSLRPLYRINIGSPGSSNALAVAQRLGLDGELIEKARGYLSDSARSYEKIINNAEAERRKAEIEYIKNLENQQKSKEILENLQREREEFYKEKEKFLASSKAEGRRIIGEKVDEANELIDEIKSILDKREIDTGDLIRARTLKNQLENKGYFQEDTGELIKEKLDSVKVGQVVFVNQIGKNAVIEKIIKNQNKAIVKSGIVKLTVPLDTLSIGKKEKQTVEVSVKRPDRVNAQPFNPEINLIGQRVDEALSNLSYFLDKALLNNVEEVRIIHGVGLKKLSTAIHAHLKTLNVVSSFRFGKYGEGESGVTIVTFK